MAKGNADPESNQRIAKTLEVLESQKTEVLEQLEPRRPQRYRTLSKIENFGRSLFQNQLEKDYLQLEKLINDLVKSVINSQPSPTAFEELLDRIEREIARNSVNISPSRLRLIYKLENLIRTVLLKNISESEGVEATRQKISFIEDLRLQREILTEAFTKLRLENQEKQQRLKRQSEQIIRLNRETTEKETEINYFRQQIEALRGENSHKQSLLNQLNEELVRSNNSRFDLESQLLSLQQQVNIFQKYKKQTLSKPELDPSKHLQSMLIKRKLLKGDYIGNLSDPDSKYHFNLKCRDWKSLVFEYLFLNDEEREIENSTRADIFKKANLEECSFCCKQKKFN